MAEDKKEETKKRVVGNIICEKCNSAYVYALADGTLVCRRCSHRTLPNKE